MNLGVAFAPLVPDYVVWAAFGVAVLISILLLVVRSRGAVVRALAAVEQVGWGEALFWLGSRPGACGAGVGSATGGVLGGKWG